MKVKEIEKTGNIAWSPASIHPVYLAIGTAAQQLDASFSTTAQIDLYSLDLEEPGLGMSLKASIPTKQRFHKLVWGSQGISGGEKPKGVIVGGADQGHMLLFDAAKLLKGRNDETGGYLLSDSKKHSGAVKALDFNPFQLNLLASGATESEIFIWDLNSPAAPMTPGTLSQPPDDVTCLAWNQQVQHILASTFATRCVVWDLRKNEPIIKVSDSTSRMRCKTVAWHPKVATQLCLASEDDQLPVIQLWDLRQATAPVNTFEGHQRGILSMDWCSQDPDLLLSCGKDNRVIIWNPNSPTPRGEILGELTTSNQWCFDTAWCPRNPSCIATASFDGRVSVHSIMGGRELAVQPTVNMIADSFPGMESAPVLQPPQQQVIVHQQLKKAPKWLRPHSGASFAFGGKLVTFGVDPGASATPQVHISQVITEEELTNRSKELEDALHTGGLAEYCTKKSLAGGKQQEAWNFLAANFNAAPRQQLLQLLGYETEESSATKSMEGLGLTDAFDSIAAEVATFTIPTDQSVDGRISKALITGSLAEAVDVCFEDKRYADAIVLAMTGPPELLNATKDRYFRLTAGGNVQRLIQAVVSRNWQQIVQHCDLANWKEALAATLTYAEDAEFTGLCQTIGQRLEAESGATSEAVLCYICAGSMEKLVDCWLRSETETTTALQEMVEQVMVLRQAQQYWGRKPTPVDSGHLTQQLCRYAGLLAGQGSLEAALTYVDLSQDESIVELKDRLQKALGRGDRKISGGMMNGSYNPSGLQQRRQSYGVPGSVSRPPASNTPTYHQQEAYNPAVPTYPPRPTTPYQTNNWSTPTNNAYNSPPVPAAPSQPPMPSPAMMAPPPPAQTFQPPPPPPASAMAPPPTTGNVSRGGPLSSRNRVYVQDPSITGGSSGSRSAGYYGSGTPQFPGFTPQPAQSSMYQSTPGQFSSTPTFQQNQYGAPPMLNSSFQSNNSQFISPAMTNGGMSYDSGTPAGFYNPMEHNASASSTPQMHNSFTQHQPLFDPSIPSITPPPSAGILPTIPTLPASNPPPGWNDPPPISSFSKAKMEAAMDSVTHPVPIMTPGVVEQPAVPVFQQYEGILNPVVPAPQQHIEPEPVQPPPVLLPIPQENLIIHDVFHTLKDKCASQPLNAQMKRKLDDVGKKLESLDDLLRNNMLSSSTFHGLHQMVQAAQAGDYATCLSLHAQVVINTPFTEIGSFISGLKVLLQMSQQLGVQYH